MLLFVAGEVGLAEAGEGGQIACSALQTSAAVISLTGRCRDVLSVAPHLRRTKSDYETGPFHSGLGRCRDVLSVVSHLRRTKSDYETGPFHSGLGRCRDVLSVAPHLRRTKSDYETDP
uniref:Uncharacterized protein n=1 Tax=Timema monikensis TaxID=170555 RepID=A0A7R9EI75_9NEOP|nr:unnamed protein product [Timema monikensis]